MFTIESYNNLTREKKKRENSPTHFLWEDTTPTADDTVRKNCTPKSAVSRDTETQTGTGKRRGDSVCGFESSVTLLPQSGVCSAGQDQQMQPFRALGTEQGACIKSRCFSSTSCTLGQNRGRPPTASFGRSRRESGGGCSSARVPEGLGSSTAPTATPTTEGGSGEQLMRSAACPTWPVLGRPAQAATQEPVYPGAQKPTVGTTRVSTNR